MATTIREFIEALEYPAASLQRLMPGAPLSLREDASGAVTRSHADFVEAELQGGGRRLLVSMPHHREALLRAGRIATKLKQLPVTLTGHYALAEGALCHSDALGCRRYEDLVVEVLPAGEFLSEKLAMGCHAQSLVGLLRRLEHEMERLGVSHGNLKEENLYLTHRGELLLARPHHMTFEGMTEEEHCAFDRLEALIRDYDLSDAEPVATVEIAPDDGVVAVGMMSDERIRIWRDGRYGFADVEGEIVIEPQFVAAGDFREGRAEVESDRGWGVIDKWGAWIVEARYDGVDYDDMEGTIRLRLGKEWALVDYSGRPLREFGTVEP